MSHQVVDDTLRKSFIRAVGLALIAGLGAIPTALLMILALVGGRGLDTALGTTPLFTLTLLCVTVPLSILAMLWLARLAIRINQRMNEQMKFPAASSVRVEEEEEDE